MAKSKQSSIKSDREKKKRQKQKEKQEKRDLRKKNSNKGKGLEHAIAYVDHYGNISDSPPDPRLKIEVKAEDIQLGPQTFLKEKISYVKSGKIANFNSEKGFGFIKDSATHDRIFFHVSGATFDVKEGDIVNYELISGTKGLNAVNIVKRT
jgi:cold shock CspA family protein